MEMEVRDDSMVGPLWLGYYKHQTAFPIANVTYATCASPTPAYMMRAHSLHTRARQRCACIFLVHRYIPVQLLPSWSHSNSVCCHSNSNPEVYTIQRKFHKYIHGIPTHVLSCANLKGVEPITKKRK